MNRFSADGLALREPADESARDIGLAQRFAASLPLIVDLGAGTNARTLAPLIAGDQHWFLVEFDRYLRAAPRDALLAWATRSGFGASEGADIVIEHAGARWRFTTVALDLAQDWHALDALGVTAAAASAFLDLASERWVGPEKAPGPFFMTGVRSARGSLPRWSAGWRRQ